MLRAMMVKVEEFNHGTRCAICAVLSVVIVSSALALFVYQALSLLKT